MARIKSITFALALVGTLLAVLPADGYRGASVSIPSLGKHTRVLSQTTRPNMRSLTNAQIEAAFAADGWNVTSWQTYGNGRGCRANSLNATTLNDGLPKYALYVEGSGYEMGALTGMLASNETTLMATTYVDQLPLELVSPKLARKAATSKYWKGIYDAVVTLLGDFITSGANKQFDESLSLFPAELVQEMHGLADAANNITGKVTYERIVTLNFGIDFLLAHVYRGSILGELRTLAANRVFPPSVTRGLRVLLSDDNKFPWFKHPYFCDAFGIKGAATASGNTIFARDFQMPVGLVFQNTNNMVIWNPTDGRYASVGASAPGFVGPITGLNTQGVSMGVDVLRTGYTNPDLPGLNSLLLIRHVVDTSATTKQAIATMAAAQRGCSWLYPMCDKSGDCVIIESGRYDNSTAPDTLSLVKDKKVLKLLPSQEELNNVTGNVKWQNGLFARPMGYQYPASFLKYNQALFEFEGVPFNATGFGGPGTYVYQTWQDENQWDDKLMANYFPPLKVTDPNTVITSNLAVVPRMRVAEMSNVADFVYRGSHAVQWRYDSLADLLHQNYGKVDEAIAKNIITFLSPDRTPGYWNVTLDPTNPMSALIEGSISAVDFETTRFSTKAGYWADDWTTLTLKNYFAQSEEWAL